LVFEIASEIVRDSIDSVGGVAVSYSRPGTGSVDVVATVGATQTEEATDDDALVKGTVRDFIIKKSVLIISLTTIEPRKGDQITDPDGNVFEVLPLGSDGVSRDSDRFGYSWRIHTKKVS